MASVPGMVDHDTRAAHGVSKRRSAAVRARECRVRREQPVQMRHVTRLPCACTAPAGKAKSLASVGAASVGTGRFDRRLVPIALAVGLCIAVAAERRALRRPLLVLCAAVLGCLGVALASILQQGVPIEAITVLHEGQSERAAHLTTARRAGSCCAMTATCCHWSSSERHGARSRAWPGCSDEASTRRRSVGSA